MITSFKSLKEMEHYTANMKNGCVRKDLKVCFLKLFLFFLWRLSGFKVRHLCKTSRENDLRERIPHTWPSSHSSSSLLGSVSYCVVFLRTPLISRLEWSHVILNLAGNSFHCRSRTASDMTCKLGITFADESKDFYVEKSGQSSCRRAKRSWLVEVRRRKRFRLDGNC